MTVTAASGAPSSNALQWTVPAPVKRVPHDALLRLLRAGVAAAPERADLALQLAKTLVRADRMAELVDRFRATVERDDTAAELRYFVGFAAAATNDLELAVSALQPAADAGFGAAFGHLAEALGRLGRTDESLAVALRGLERSPSDFRSLGIVVRLLLERGDVERLWALCGDLRARGTWNAYVPSAMALAATTPEHDAEVAALVDPARWFAVTQLAVPDDYNDALAAELLAHAAAMPLPSTKATSGKGRRIDQLQLAGGPLVHDLLERIRTEVGAYVVQRQGDVAHPMIARRPVSVALNAWALAVHDDGHENWHMHPDGWISGVYYVAVPPVDPHGNARPGAIEFGPSPFGTSRSVRSWPHAFVMPRPGMLLLFPSYYGHRTWPTRVADPRIVVAFDVVSATEPEARH